MTSPRDDMDSGLFNIALSDSDDDAAAAAAAAAAVHRDRRTGQTEQDFGDVRRTYRAKVENGEIWKCVKIPPGGGGGAARVPKHEAQEMLHAVEELYFYGRFGEAAGFVARLLSDGGRGEGLDGDVRELLRAYGERCRAKLGGRGP